MLQLVLLLCYLASLAGFMSVAWLVSWYQAGRLLLATGPLAAPRWQAIGCPQAATECSKPRPPTEHSHTLTGTSVIDDELQRALQYGMRDFVQSWFHVWVSANTAFPDEVQRAVSTMATDLTKRCGEADLATLLSQTVLEECLSYLARCKETRGDTEGCLGSRVLASLPDNDPWTSICLQPEAQKAYFQGVTELLLCLILPPREFASPLLRPFLTDMLTQQVWLPLLHTLSTPDYINTALISLCKEPSLNSESFLAAVRTPHSQTEVEGLRDFVAMETDRLKARGVSGTDQQRLASLDVVMTTIENQLEGKPDDDVEEETECPLPLSLSVTIPEYMVKRGRHVTYSVHVQCQHSGVEVVEGWTTSRQFSDFHDLHMSLRSMFGFLPSSLSLPSHRALKKLDPSFLDARRRGLEYYLQTLVSDPVLSRYPQALPLISLFISEEVYRRSSNELNRQVDRLIHPFRKQASLSSSKLTPLPATSNKAISSPSLLRRQQQLNDSRDEEEDQDLDLLLGLLDGLFDLRDHGQWLRRQLAHMLSQLLGDRVSRKVAQGVAWLTSPEQVSQYCRDLTNTVWPGGVRPSYKLTEEEVENGGEEEEEKVRMLRCVLARAKLIGSVPDDLRRLLGTRQTTQGMTRLSHLLQERSLNCWLCLRLFEAALQSLFPSHSLSPTLRSLRQQLHSTGLQ